MLIEFKVGNYLSFKDKKTLSLEATAIKENLENVIESGNYKLLRSAVIYGANSSGKSNFLKAMDRMRWILMTSAQNNSTSEIDVVPFLLSTETENQPSHFEILILINGVRYRYGFEASNKIIHSEWLYERKIRKEKLLFIRVNDSIEVTKDFVEGSGLEEKTRDNALFLSIVDQFNGTISKKIMNWFNQQSNLSGLLHEKGKPLTLGFLKDVDLTIWIKDFLSPLGLGIQDFVLKDSRILTIHNKFDKSGNVIDKHEFDLLKQESAGTNKLYDMAGHLTYGLKLGALTVIDELDAKLHPLLTMAIVKLFNSPIHNNRNAQLVFATHDTNLLNFGCFRRDQIYFTEKNRFEATDLYSLVEYIEPNGNKVRNDRSFEKDYIAGRYGAIPFIGDFTKLISNGESSKD
ncbi:MAG: ATP-binding protein [Bacteroidales bacterium]|nr:ATP-binding protein [Bacteroidales bacterium]